MLLFLGDYIKVQIKYKFKECFPVQCNVDLCQLTCEYNDMVIAAQKNGCDKELAEKLLIINAKINQALIGKMQPLCKVDVGKLVAEIKEIGGFSCDCDSGKGIVALINPAGNNGVADCNAVISCVNGIFNQVDPHCLFPGWSASSLLIKLQQILDLLAGDKCSCVPPQDVIFKINPFKLQWRSTNNTFQWKIERVLNNNGMFEQITSPAPSFIGNGFWEIDLSALVFVSSGSYKFYVTSICGTGNSSIKAESSAYIPNGCTALNFDNVTAIPNAVVGQAYVHNRIITGTAPFAITGTTVKPAWMNIAIVGNILQFTGTPLIGDVQSNITVSVIVSNGCGLVVLSAGFNVTANCVPISFVAPVLTDAQDLQAYGVNIALLGSGPFSISGIVAPSWMNFVIAGTTLQITGTPSSTDVANNINVGFGISNNCGIQNFTDIINVNNQPCTPVSFTNPTLPDAQESQAYVVNIALNGQAPFNLTGVTKPSWMNIVIVGSTVQITGTPPFGSNTASVVVAFTVNNGCGSQAVSTSIVVNDTCVPVNFLLAPGIPDATANEAYVFNRALTGSAPFFLTGVVKPSWMMIQIVGSTLELSGTPTPLDVATVVPINFVVNNNCGSRGDSRNIAVKPECTQVIVAGYNDPSLPDARVGVLYNVNKAITGTAPYGPLDQLVGIPAWLTVAIVGNNLNFTGTPQAADEQVNVVLGYRLANPCTTISGSHRLTVTPQGAPTIPSNISLFKMVSFPIPHAGFPSDNFIIELNGTPILSGIISEDNDTITGLSNLIPFTNKQMVLTLTAGDSNFIMSAEYNNIPADSIVGNVATWNAVAGTSSNSIAMEFRTDIQTTPAP